jgi:hypothetical protein
LLAHREASRVAGARPDADAAADLEQTCGSDVAAVVRTSLRGWLPARALPLCRRGATRRPPRTAAARPEAQLDRQIVARAEPRTA